MMSSGKGGWLIETDAGARGIRPISLTSNKKRSEENYLEKEELVKDVHATDLNISSGAIRYQGHCLKSKFIGVYSSDILAQIDRTFTIKLSNHYKPGEKEPELDFEPHSDFAELINIANRLQRERKLSVLSDVSKTEFKNNTKVIHTASPNVIKKTDMEDLSFPADGEFRLPWRFVQFYDGGMYLMHPNADADRVGDFYNFRHHSILKAFSNIIPYIEETCSKFLVRAKNNQIVGLRSFESFEKLIPQFTEQCSFKDDEFVWKTRSKMDVESSYSWDQFNKMHWRQRSKYMRRLSEIHCRSYKIPYLLESVDHENSGTDEYGFLFTIYDGLAESVVVFENTIEDQSRCTLAFRIRARAREKAINTIRRFLGSHIINKREKIAQGTFRFNDMNILQVFRIFHSDFHEWNQRMQVLATFGR